MRDRSSDLPPFVRRRCCPRRYLDGQPIHTAPARRPTVRRAYEDGAFRTTQTHLRPLGDLLPVRRPSSPRPGPFWTWVALAAAIGSWVFVLGLVWAFAVLWLSFGRSL